MLYLVTRRRITYTPVDANSPEKALELAGNVLEEDWYEDDRPDEFSIECEPVDDSEE